MLYIIRCTGTGFRKIGSTTGAGAESVMRRLGELQTGSASPLLLEAVSPGEEIPEERSLHRELWRARVRRGSEWFAVTLEEIEAASVRLSGADSHYRFSYTDIHLKCRQFQWRRFARACWTRVSERGFEPRVLGADRFLDEGVDSGAPEPCPATVERCRRWMRENCVRIHSWGLRSDTLATCMGAREHQGAVIAAAIAEGFPAKRSFMNLASLCLRLRRGAP